MRHRTLDERLARDLLLGDEPVHPLRVDAPARRESAVAERLDLAADQRQSGVIVESRRLAGEPLRVHLVVGVHSRDERRAAGGEARVQRGHDAARFLTQDADPRIIGRALLQDPWRVVPGAGGDTDEGAGDVPALEHRRERGGKRRRGVPDGEQHGDPGAVSAQVSGHADSYDRRPHAEVSSRSCTEGPTD